MRSLIKNKKGDIESITLMVILLFAIGVVFIMSSNLTQNFLSKMAFVINDTSSANANYTVERVETIKAKDAVVWDYAFLGLFFGSIIALGLTAYATRFSPIFFWVYVLLSLIIVVVSVMLSNFWQDLVTQPDMAATLSYYPMTNMILGTYYPTIVTAIIAFVLILTFGKTPTSEGAI